VAQSPPIIRPPTVGVPSVPLPPGDVFTPTELKKCWKLSEQTIRQLFQDEGGVLRRGETLRGRRSYTALRIPGAVAGRASQARNR
jgi:hypothetical protein